MTTDEQADQIRREMVESGQPVRDLAALQHTADCSQSADECKCPPVKTWTTADMQAEFTVLGFGAPFVVVVRKADNVKGTLEFTHSPRVYFNWQEAGE